MRPVIFEVNEGVTARYQGVLKDETGAVIPAASLSTLTLTLYRKTSGEIINGRNAQNVLNANGVTVDVNGNLTWTMTPADNGVTSTTVAAEMHIALFEWTYNAGNKAGNHEVWINVLQLANVP